MSIALVRPRRAVRCGFRSAFVGVALAVWTLPAVAAPAPKAAPQPTPKVAPKPVGPAEGATGNDAEAKTPDPVSFAQGFDTSDYMVRSAIRFQDLIKDAKTKDEKAKVAKELQAHLRETSRIVRVTLSLVDEKSDPEKVNHLRYSLGYVDYQLGKNLDAAVVGAYLARVLQKDDPETSLKSAMLALACWTQSFSTAPAEARELHVQQMAKVVEFVTKSYGDKPEAIQARLALAQVAVQSGQAGLAAELFAKIPPESPAYVASQLAAGRAFWTAYLKAAGDAAAGKGESGDLPQLLKLAESHLRAGVDKTQKELKAGEEPSQSLIAGKLTLAQIQINAGKYPAAIDLLKKPPAAVLDATVVPDGQPRPATGLKTAATASLVWQLLLRAYIGTGQLDEAQSAMTQLEALGGASGASMTGIYVKLGQELEQELKRLRATGEADRAEKTRKSFETLLDNVFARKETLSFGSLSWIAETFFALGEGIADDRTAAAAYYAKAAGAYGEILARGAKDAKFMPATRRDSVTLRLANCRRQAGEFQKALDDVVSVLRARKTAVDAQIEAARILETWGEREPATAAKRFLAAINGQEVVSGGATVKVWGWYDLSRRLKEAMDKGSTSATFADNYWMARYRSNVCHRRYALAQTDAAKKRGELERALRAIALLASTTDDVPEPWWTQLDELSQQIQKDLGRVPQKLVGRP